MPEQHDTLAKYCPAPMALAIIETQTLRWSAPALFADPFELNHRTTLAFDPHSLLDSVIRAACGMIFARDVPRGTSPLSTVIRRWRDEERFGSPEEAEEALHELMARMVDQRQNAIDEMLSDWRQYTRALRICSFSTRADNLLAWQHYADCHRGAVLKFACGEHTSLPHPKPVSYNPIRPEISSLKDQLNAVLHNEPLHPQDNFESKFLSKPPTAKGEKEWRCFTEASEEDGLRDNDEQHWFIDKPFAQDELKAVYLGAFMPITDKKALLDAVKKHNPDTKVFQALAVAGKYEVEFVGV
ncbi:DUF2971 domain-containing protein [Gilvimarinus polysaccharolyticus]|uniref:DUF2971 domain-containing protein n=1 Tax=Gilvimarinus polysaccharolyticus TaxID=863921 RepID=UPI0006736F7F|nr:DUF2971 domain-containing protein [Gilvimarinus polysaccharolyticus]